MVVHTRTGTLDSLQIIGRSPSITRLKARIPHLAADSGPLVITGETGNGKSLLASQIHLHSPRKSIPLQKINFSILAEREQRRALFGGGPPELASNRRSLLEIPSTLIIKHIDYASPFLQEKLVEALATRKFTRLGTNSVQFAQARLIFTFRYSLSDLNRRNRIIEPLYRSLSQFQQISIPPLRKRKEDILPLANYFFKDFIHRYHRTSQDHPPIILGLTKGGKLEPGLKNLLLKQSWPENVLGLKAYLRSLVVGSYREAWVHQERVELMKMNLMIEEGSEFSLRQSLLIIEEGIIQRALAKNAGHRTRAAQLLGITDRAYRRKKISA